MNETITKVGPAYKDLHKQTIRERQEAHSKMILRLATHPEHPTLISYGGSNRWTIDTRALIGTSLVIGTCLVIAALAGEDSKDYVTTLTAGGTVGAQQPEQSSTIDPQIKAMEEAIKAASLHNPELKMIDQIQPVMNHLALYLDKDLGARTIERFSKVWEVLPVSDPLQIVLEADPINVRDFSDTRFGRRIRNSEPVDGYYYKVLRANPYKRPIDGFFQSFIFIRNPQTLAVESIWAVLDLRKDPTDIKGEKMEVFAVYHTGEKDPYLTSFIREGRSLKGEDVFGSYLNQGRKTSDGARIYDNGAIGPNRADLAWLNSIS